jgi:hypothetical protein
MNDNHSVNSNSKTTITYRAFLLRLWREKDPALEGKTIWRFSLESTHQNERLGFASLEDLMAYLRHQIDPPST